MSVVLQFTVMLSWVLSRDAKVPFAQVASISNHASWPGAVETALSRNLKFAIRSSSPPEVPFEAVQLPLPSSSSVMLGLPLYGSSTKLPALEFGA